MKKEKTGWLKASILILIWTIYYYAKRYTGGLVDDMDNIVCGLTGFICIFIVIFCLQAIFEKKGESAMIIKNEIPILEFDTDASAVIMPTHENLNLNLPKKAVFAFLGDYIDEYAKTHHAVQVGKFLSATKDYPIYVTRHRGEDVCLCQAPVGSAPAAQLMDWLIGY